MARVDLSENWTVSRSESAARGELNRFLREWGM